MTYFDLMLLAKILLKITKYKSGEFNTKYLLTQILHKQMHVTINFTEFYKLKNMSLSSDKEIQELASDLLVEKFEYETLEYLYTIIPKDTTVKFDIDTVSIIENICINELF